MRGRQDSGLGHEAGPRDPRAQAPRSVVRDQRCPPDCLLLLELLGLQRRTSSKRSPARARHCPTAPEALGTALASLRCKQHGRAASSSVTPAASRGAGDPSITHHQVPPTSRD